MQFKFCILAVLAASFVNARRICGTPNATPQEIQAVEDAQRIGTDTEILSTGIEINVYFHVVATSNRVDDGYIPDSQISRQLNALTEAYKPHKITFKWGGTVRVLAPQWADNCKEIEMKETLQKGTFADLNVYFFPSIYCVNRVFQGDDTTLGYASSIPGVKKISSLMRTLDAVHIRSDTIPGAAKPFDEGKTLVHEVGHWLGLQHTFKDGCYGAGDGISDTPPEDYDTAMDAAGTCKRRNSCPGGGDDPIENYMDYSSDVCLVKFTPKQVTRMFNTWTKYREPYKKI